jgi:hypothetical protein
MITNAWIISQQDSVHFNQIKSTEMLGYFFENKLYRFDALGGVSAIFYMVDEDVVTTVNVKESKTLTAAMKDGNAQRLLYMESIKSDAYPVGELEASKQRLKGFEWRAEERPVTREAITKRQVRKSERSDYDHLSRPLYPETNKYFDNYMYNLIEELNAQKREALARRQHEQDSIARVQDSLARLKMLEEEIPGQARNDDSVGALPQTPPLQPANAQDSTSRPPLAPDGALDTTTIVTPGLTRGLDSSRMTPVVVPFETIDRQEEVTHAPASPETVEQSTQLTRAEKRALRRAERKARREARRAARLARRAQRQAAKHAS